MSIQSMIAGCPKCGARYRVDASKLGPDGARLRCARCEVVFRVTAPAQPMLHVEPEPELAAPVAPRAPERAQSVAPRRALAEVTQPDPGVAPENLVLLADPDVQAGKAVAHALAGWGFDPILVHDGVEAILTIQRTLPKVVVLDAGLPKMFGFQVCELMKRNESLRGIHVVLVGSIHHEDRYRRRPNEIYGADAYVERPQLPEALRPILRGFGLEPGSAVRSARAPQAPEAPRPRAPIAPEPVREPAAPRARPAPQRAPEPRPAAPRSPEPRAVAPVREAAPAAAKPSPPVAAKPSRAIADAERLARIIVSDIVLYNPEKFEAAIRAGNVVDALESELEEGRGLFQQRVDPSVRGSKDFLAEELVRVARQRGMK